MPWYAEKVGPLPMGVWVGSAAVGVGFAVYRRRQAANAAPAPGSTEAPLDPTQGALALPGGGAGSASGVTSIGSSPILTNEDWERQAATDLIAHGYDPALVDTALRDYISGNNLNTNELAILELALKLDGPPPMPVPPPVAAPPATVAPPPVFLGSGYAPPGYHTGNQTATEIAAEETIVKSGDGYCYQWLATPAARNALPPGTPTYLQIAPGTFVPETHAVPGGTAAEYVQVGCP